MLPLSRLSCPANSWIKAARTLFQHVQMRPHFSLTTSLTTRVPRHYGVNCSLGGLSGRKLTVSARLQSDWVNVGLLENSTVEKESKEHQLETEPTWTETFGTLADDEDMGHSEIEDIEELEEEVEEEKPFRRLDTVGRRHQPTWYTWRINKLAEEGKIYEAIDVLETQMLKEDRVKPTLFVYIALLRALGSVGYTQKAFSVFNQMKKYGIKPNSAVYTQLFRACSRSPWSTDGLQRANHVRELMASSELTPSRSTYSAMMTAYSSHGDVLTVFRLVDEMMADGYRPDEHTFLVLLRACTMDREAGLKHAVEVWRKLRKSRMTPAVEHYNMLLRTTHRCGLGDEEFAMQLLRQRTTKRQDGTNKTSLQRQEQVQPLIQGSQGSEDDTEYNTSLVAISEDSNPPQQQQHHNYQPDNELVPALENKLLLPVFSARRNSVLDSDVPNLLNPRAKFRQLVCLRDVDTSAKRLRLLGGVPGVLSHMHRDNVKANIVTFTLLLNMIPSRSAVEEDLLSVMSQHAVKPDVFFMNCLIKKRTRRKDFKAAKGVVEIMTDYKISPDTYTFGALANACFEHRDAVQLFRDMESVGCAPNIHICRHLVHKAHLNFPYIATICRTMSKFSILPDDVFLRSVERSIAAAKKLIVEQEQGRSAGDSVTEKLKTEFQDFMKWYKPWLKKTGLDKADHPWAHLQRPSLATQEEQLTTTQEEQLTTTKQPRANYRNR